MSETPAAYAKRRAKEIEPLVAQCLPGTRLHIEHFHVTSEELEKIIANLGAKAPPELSERHGAEKAERLEKVFRGIAQLKMAEIDYERLSKLSALAVELVHRGYTVAWEDQDPRDEIEFSELDLQALNFERAAVPKEGTFLTISFDAEA